MVRRRGRCCGQYNVRSATATDGGRGLRLVCVHARAGLDISCTPPCVIDRGDSPVHRVTFGGFIVLREGVGTIQSLVSSWRIAFATIAGGAYASAPVPIAVAAAGSLAGGMASIDRLYRYGLIAMSWFTSATHAWVLQSVDEDSRKRQMTVLALHLAVAFVGGIGLAILGPTVTAWLFGPDVAADGLLCALYGFAFAMVTLSTPLIQNLLIPFHRQGVVATATAIGVIVGIPCMLVGVGAIGTTGIVGALAITEFVCLLALLPASLSVLRRIGRPSRMPTADESRGAHRSSSRDRS